MLIERWEPRRDGALDETALRHKLEARGFVVSPRAYPAGSTTAVQPAAGERVCAVITGLVKLMLDADAVILKAGDIVIIPTGIARRMEAIGQTAARCLEGSRMTEHAA